MSSFKTDALLLICMIEAKAMSAIGIEKKYNFSPVFKENNVSSSIKIEEIRDFHFLPDNIRTEYKTVVEQRILQDVNIALQKEGFATHDSYESLCNMIESHDNPWAFDNFIKDSLNNAFLCPEIICSISQHDTENKFNIAISWNVQDEHVIVYESEITIPENRQEMSSIFDAECDKIIARLVEDDNAPCP